MDVSHFLCTLATKCNYMKTPRIKINGQPRPVTELPNEELVSGFLACAAEPEALEAVQLLCYAEPSPKKAGQWLRKALLQKREFVAVYPGNNEKAPEGAEFVGDILDGALYLAKA